MKCAKAKTGREKNPMDIMILMEGNIWHTSVILENNFNIWKVTHAIDQVMQVYIDCKTIF